MHGALIAVMVAMSHLMTESPYALDFTIQFIVVAATVVVFSTLVGPEVTWMLTVPPATVLFGGILIHRVHDSFIPYES
jgi:hypothetical protein